MTSKAAKINRLLIAQIAARASTDPKYICDDGERWWDVLVKLKDGRVLKTGYYARTKPTLNQMADRLAQCGCNAWSEIVPPHTPNR
jgi:hypothetical protein